MSPPSLASRLDARPPRRVLVVQTAWLGDTVFVSALVEALAVRFPRAAIELCVSARGADVARAMPHAAAVHVYDKRGADAGPSGLLRMARRLRERGFDLALLPHASLRSGLLVWLARVPLRIGFRGAAGQLFYTDRVAAPARGYLDRDAQLARAVGARPAAPRLVARPPELETARRALPEGRIAALCVGSEWGTKRWPAERFEELARTLTARGLTPVVLGGPRDRALAAQVPSARDLTGNPVGEALAMLSLSKLCVGGDTGLVHAARALGVPTVALFGPTTPDVHVWGARDRPVSLRLDCSPCGAHGPQRCPLGHHRCLRELSPASVAAACEGVAP